MAIDTHKLTATQFWEQYAGQPYELVNGEAVYVAPSGMKASAVARRVAARLGDFVDDNALGEVTGADGGFMLDDENLRAPDAAFISTVRLQDQPDDTKFVHTAPDLAVEVVSPTDRAADVQRKIALYLEKGVRLVWVFYPETHTVIVHYPDGSAQALNETASLDGEDVLPGFSLPIASVFPSREG